MNLPGAERAVADISKLRDYCLNPFHPRGRHKARAFRAALNLGSSDSEWLRTELLAAALTGEAVEGESDEHGSRYILDFQCAKGTRLARVRSVWMVRHGEEYRSELTHGRT